MFQLSDLNGKGVAISEHLVALCVEGVMASELVLPLVNGSLDLQSKFGFVSLDDQMGQDIAQERAGLLACGVPDKLVAMDWVSRAVTVDVQRASVGLPQSLDDRQVGHAYPRKDLVTDVNAVGLRPLRDADVTLAVEQPGGVSMIKHDGLSLSEGWDVGEVGGNPMPGPKGCGRATPSQAGGRDWPLGVCNEQGPTAKAKACSELHGNMQRSAEMIDPAMCISRCEEYTRQVTDCNTDYLFWRPHRDRDMVPLEKVNSINQDATVQLIIWMGNMTASNRQLQGVMFQT